MQQDCYRYNQRLQLIRTAAVFILHTIYNYHVLNVLSPLHLVSYLIFYALSSYIPLVVFCNFRMKYFTFGIYYFIAMLRNMVNFVALSI